MTAIDTADLSRSPAFQTLVADAKQADEATQLALRKSAVGELGQLKKNHLSRLKDLAAEMPPLDADVAKAQAVLDAAQVAVAEYHQRRHRLCSGFDYHALAQQRILHSNVPAMIPEFIREMADLDDAACREPLQSFDRAVGRYPETGRPKMETVSNAAARRTRLDAIRAARETASGMILTFAGTTEKLKKVLDKLRDDIPNDSKMA